MRRNPLVAVVLFFVAGVALGVFGRGPVQFSLGAAGCFWLLWLTAELALTDSRRAWTAQAWICLALLCGGAAVGQLNQRFVSTNHIARLCEGDDPVPVAARLQVVTPPLGDGGHGNLYWVGRASSVLGQRGWMPATGDVRVKWRGGDGAPGLERGDVVEVYGWLQRPARALNPGAIDLRKTLAADRIFAEIRIPRSGGVVMLSNSGAGAGADWLTRMRLFLRAKLLRHTMNVNAEAGYSMVALLLGRRDPVISNVSQAFAQAGVAHLLAISGTHIVFFTALIWALLRFVPLRPRWRECLVAFFVLAYVLATPCGPPVIRAAIVLLMVLLTRLLGRPRMYMNMLAAAALVVVLLRPADVLDAGAQLTFLCTAALIILSPRLYAAVFGQWLERERIITDLNGGRWARLKFRLTQTACGLLAANIIGAGVAIPLVAFHFGRVNIYAVFTGLIALPFVAATMAASALQLFLELTCSTLAACFAPVSTGVARLMVWVIEHLAALPAASVAVRAPPVWLILLVYAVIFLWAARRWLRVKRAFVANGALLVLAIAAGWYVVTQPRGELQMEVLSVGQGSTVIVRMPSGQTWMINAGSRDHADIVDQALAPALRVAGVDRLNGFVVTSLDTVAGQDAAAVIDRFRPPVVLTSTSDWDHRGWTFAGAQLEDALQRDGARQVNVGGGCTIRTGTESPLRVLWPLQDRRPPAPAGLVLLFEYRGHRILLMDPAQPLPLFLLERGAVDSRVDAILFLGPQRGSGDDALRKLLAATGARTLIWSGRNPWAPAQEKRGEPNTAFGAVKIRIDSAGKLTITR